MFVDELHKNSERINVLSLAVFEYAVFGLGDRRIIHYAIGTVRMKYIL